jgi:hypothetical protein
MTADTERGTHQPELSIPWASRQMASSFSWSVVLYLKAHPHSQGLAGQALGQVLVAGVSDLLSLGWSLRIHISNLFPDDTGIFN